MWLQCSAIPSVVCCHVRRTLLSSLSFKSPIEWPLVSDFNLALLLLLLLMFEGLLKEKNGPSIDKHEAVFRVFGHSPGHIDKRSMAKHAGVPHHSRSLWEGGWDRPPSGAGLPPNPGVIVLLRPLVCSRAGDVDVVSIPNVCRSLIIRLRCALMYNPPLLPLWHEQDDEALAEVAERAHYAVFCALPHSPVPRAPPVSALYTVHRRHASVLPNFSSKTLLEMSIQRDHASLQPPKNPHDALLPFFCRETYQNTTVAVMSPQLVNWQVRVRGHLPSVQQQQQQHFHQ